MDLIKGVHCGKIGKMSSSDLRTIRDYFSKLGLSSEIADIYATLQSYGQQTISELARHSGIERTRIYRLIDELRASNLVEIETRYKRSVFTAAPITNLHVLLARQEQELSELRNELQDLQQIFPISSLQSPASKVQAYRGTEGLKQMFWNQTRSKSDCNSILYESMQVLTQRTYFERWAKAICERKIKSRSIVGDNFIRTQQDWYKKHTNERMADWEGRYIPAAIFPIAHSTVVYDNVTAYFNWKDGEIFGIEIHNQEIADAQRRFFEMLWAQTQELDKAAL